MNQEEYVTDLLNKLKKNKYVLSFLNKYQCDFSVVEKNSDLFNDYVATLEKCENCEGMEFCRQKMNGRIKILYLDQGKYLENKFVPCKFKQKQQKQIVHKTNYRLSDLADQEYTISLENIDLRNESRNYLSVYDKITEPDPLKGIYLYGQPGAGKTYLMIGLANQYARNGKKVSFVKVPQLIRDCKDNMFENEYIASIISHLKFSDVVFLDDIGSESISPWTRDSILLPVLNYRMDHHLKTYFTSNYTLEELEEQYYIKGKDANRVAAKRLLERIIALSTDIALLGKSRR